MEYDCVEERCNQFECINWVILAFWLVLDSFSMALYLGPFPLRLSLWLCARLCCFFHFVQWYREPSVWGSLGSRIDGWSNWAEFVVTLAHSSLPHRFIWWKSSAFVHIGLEWRHRASNHITCQMIENWRFRLLRLSNAARLSSEKKTEIKLWSNWTNVTFIVQLYYISFLLSFRSESKGCKSISPQGIRGYSWQLFIIFRSRSFRLLEFRIKTNKLASNHHFRVMPFTYSKSAYFILGTCKLKYTYAWHEIDKLMSTFKRVGCCLTLFTSRC